MNEHDRHSNFWEKGRGKWIKEVIETSGWKHESSYNELYPFTQGIVECLYASDKIEKEELLNLLEAQKNVLNNITEMIEKHIK